MGFNSGFKGLTGNSVSKFIKSVSVQSDLVFGMLRFSTSDFTVTTLLLSLEGISYKPQGRGFYSRYPWDHLNHWQKWVLGISPVG